MCVCVCVCTSAQTSECSTVDEGEVSVVRVTTDSLTEEPGQCCLTTPTPTRARHPTHQQGSSLSQLSECSLQILYTLSVQML